MGTTHALDRELKTYSEHLPELAGQAGKYVLIHGKEVAGTFDTYEDAVTVGYKTFKLKAFLVKQISPAESAMSFTRDLQLASDHS